MGCSASHSEPPGEETQRLRETSAGAERRAKLLQAAALIEEAGMTSSSALAKTIQLLAHSSRVPADLTQWLCTTLKALQPLAPVKGGDHMSEEPSEHDLQPLKDFSPHDIKALSERATRAEEEAKRLHRVLIWTENLHQREQDELKLARSTAPNHLARFLLSSPIGTAVAMLRDLAIKDEAAAPAIEEVIQIIERHARFSVDVREELEKLEETGTKIDVGMRAFLMETMESADKKMPNWASGSFSTRDRREGGGATSALDLTSKKSTSSLFVPGLKRRALSTSTKKMFRSSPNVTRLMANAADSILRQPLPLARETLDWDCDIMVLNQQRNGKALSLLFVHLLDQHNLITLLNLNRGKLISFITCIEKFYGNNPYHSSVHGADVLLGMSLFISEFVGVLQPWQHLAALLAAACHDFDHPGTTNAHEVKVSSQRAIRHHDESVLECHHLERVFSTLMEPRYNFLCDCSREMYVDIRKLVITLILATDLSKHFDFISRIHTMGAGSLKCSLDFALQSKREPSSDEFDPSSDLSKGPAVQRRASERFSVRDREGEKLAVDIDLFLIAGIKFCDLGHSIKLWEQHEKWSLAVTKEFYLLGDWERSIDVPISPLCDREKDTNLTKSQRGFLEFVVMPFYTNVNRILPVHDRAINNLQHNFRQWEHYEMPSILR